jgi:hypothetical protein
VTGFTSRPISFWEKYFLGPLGWRFDLHHSCFLSGGEEETSVRPQNEFSSFATKCRDKMDTEKTKSVPVRHNNNYCGSLPAPTTVVFGLPSPIWMCFRHIVLDFKLLPCCECFLSCGWCLGAWILCAYVSEHSVPYSYILWIRRRGFTQKKDRDHTNYENGTECSETSAHKMQTPGNHPKERIPHVTDSLRV